MKVKKPKSKRTPVRLRHKIEKASAAKQRKDRKLAKKDPTWRSRLKKDPGIPNLFPYKDRILAEVEEKKQLKQEEAARRKEEAKALRKASSMAASGELPDDEDEMEDDADDMEPVGDDDMDDDDPGDSSNPMAALLASARARAEEYDAIAPEGDDESLDDDDDGNDEYSQPAARPDPSARAFSHLFPEVLSSADIILYVLDARDPQSTRSIPTERQVAAASGGSKRLLLILNKIDLVPPQVLARWLGYLRRYHLTLPLRASAPAPNAKTYDHKGLTQKGTSETLLRALKAYATKQQLKRALTVGVVGFPNVGKSSVINTLVAQLGRRNAPAPTGSEAGVTTALRTVKLDSKLTLLDSPGVVFPVAEIRQKLGKDTSKETEADANARLVLLNAVPPKTIDDPVPAVQLLLRRVAALPDGLETLRSYYGISPLLSRDGDVSTDFLLQVARKRGRLGKGGVPNLNAAGMTVLGDWRDGRIGAWVEPPEIPVVSGNSVTSKARGQSVVDDVDMSGADVTARAENESEEHADRKEVVTEWAKEFEIEGLWGPGTDGEEQ